MEEWEPVPEPLALRSDEVHVWRAALEPRSAPLESLWQTLTPDECARADRFHFAHDRERFIVARGLLRAILGRYLREEPTRLRFEYSRYGKPALAREWTGTGLRFNLSHSGGLALYAITRGREVGIDLERHRADLADEAIAERFFSRQEVATLRALPPEQRGTAFFAIWTRKEAFLKANGQGLSLPLDQFDVSVTPGEPASVLSTRWDPQEASRWSLQELFPGPGYTAALAVEGHGWQLNRWQWQG